MKNYLIYTAILEVIFFIGLVIFTLWIGREYDDLNKFKNN